MPALPDPIPAPPNTPDWAIPAAPGVAGSPPFQVAIIVAHPDDETLWAGGLLLQHPEWSPWVVGLCRRGDPDRAPRFFRALEQLGARGCLGELDDEPEQPPQSAERVESLLRSLLPDRPYDLILTHGSQGEYTRHLRHEETARAVLRLCRTGVIQTRDLWQFAFQDEQGTCLPKAILNAAQVLPLPASTWARKRWILTEIYGFADQAWETRTCPREEAFQPLAWPAASPPALPGEPTRP